MAAEGARVQISFPQHAAALLDSLNRLRLEGKFCDVAVHVGGRVFPAHKSVLAAASPFFHDKLLLQDGGRLLLPPAIDPEAFEGLLHLIYSGRLTLLLEALPGHLLVASGLQMWHVVDQCSEILRELEGGACRWGGRSDEAASPAAVPWPTRGSAGSSSSSRSSHGGDGSSRTSCGGDGASSWSIRGGSGGDGPPWATRGGDAAPPPFAKEGGEEVLKIRVATDAAPAASLSSLLRDSSEEVLKICLEDEEEEEEEEEEESSPQHCHQPTDALQIVLEEEEEEEEDDDRALGDAQKPPNIFYIKQEESDTAGAIEDLLPAAEPASSFAPAEVSYVIPAGTSGAGTMVTANGTMASGMTVMANGTMAMASGMMTMGNGTMAMASGMMAKASGSTAMTNRMMAKANGSTAMANESTTMTNRMTAKANRSTPPPAASSLYPQPSWKPVDLHGNEILGHGQALHAPVKLGAAPDGKRFGCLCGKRFAVKPKRDRHIMLTFSLRPFGCPACHKRFKLKHHLTEHLKTHDGAARACEGCGRRFRLRSGLAKHRPLCPGPRWGGGCWACE